MTTYSYSCDKCETRTDKEFAMGQAPRQIKCPKCGKEAKRLYEATAVLFKGNGWPSKSMKFKKEMTDKNNISRNKMKDNNPSVFDTM